MSEIKVQKEREAASKLEVIRKKELKIKDEMISILSTSPQFDAHEITYVILYLMHCPMSGVPGELRYAFCQTENDARITYAEKLKIIVDLVAEEDDRGIWGDDGEQYLYYYWCCLLKIPARLQTAEEFDHFFSEYIKEREVFSNDSRYEAYNELFKSFAIEDECSQEIDNDYLDDMLEYG